MRGRGRKGKFGEKERPLRRARVEAIPAVLGVIFFIVASGAVFDAVALPRPKGEFIVLADVGTAILCLAFRAAWTRWPRWWTNPDAVFWGIGALLGANALATMSVSGDILYTAQIVLLIVCSSSVFASVRWLAALIALVVAGWLPLAMQVAPGGAFSAGAFTLGLASAAAVAFHWMRTRTDGKMLLLRARDRVRSTRLRGALAVARSELVRRRRAEVEGGQLRDQLLQAQKMEAVARLAGGVAHDMNNVLTTITTVGELLLEDERLGDVGMDDVASILSAARRGTALSRNLLAFSRRGKYSAQLLDVAALVDSARHVLSRTLPKEIEIEVSLHEGAAHIEGDASQLVQALVNLGVNAADAMPDGGIVQIRTSLVDLAGGEAHKRAVAPGQYVAIQVQDSGEGMDSETRRLAFEPFFTTKPEGTGSGLGLAMVYGTARNHGGSAEVESALGGGTVVTMHVPCSTTKTGHDSAAPPSGPRNDVSKKSVLLVDDEPSIRAVARRILERMGLRVRDAENGRRALATWTADGPFDLVVLDMAMPIMGGKDFFVRLRKHDPHARVLLVSGFAPDGDAQELLAAGAVGFVEKPYTPTALSRAVRAALVGEPDHASAPPSKVGS